jgi:hypothetical protein
MSQYSKNEIYKKVFNKFCDSYNGDKKNFVDSLEEINYVVNKVEKDLNMMINKIYQPRIEQTLEKNDEENIKITPAETKIVADEIQELPQNKLDLQPQVQILTKQLENFNLIQRELEEIIRENFKNRRDENELSRRNSEVVLIEKDEFIDCNKRIPIELIEERENKIKIELNSKDSNIDEIKELIDIKFKKILTDVRKINEYTKLPENSSKFLY